LNPEFYHIICRFIGHVFTKYNSTTPQVDIKYDHDQLIGVDGNVFYGSNIFTLANNILSLESKSFASRKESLMLSLYKNLELTKHLKQFSDRYKAIFKDTTISNKIILAGGGGLGDNRKTKRYKSLKNNKNTKLTMIIKKYNDKTKKNLFQLGASCNCHDGKAQHTKNKTKKIINF